MKDEHDSTLDELIRLARAEPRDTSRLEYGFETRLMARLRAQRCAPDVLLFRWALRLSPIFAGIVLILGWATFSSISTSDLNEAAAHKTEDLLLVESLTGEKI